ncbi:MAG TPA: hypothetical protein PLA01_08630 [Acetivibrio sp.]|nr:hypothetical protein [Acetivibrio sp.]
MSDYDKRLNQIKESLDKANNLRIRAEAKLEQLSRQKEDILSELKEMGVEPENLDSEIRKLKDDIEDLITKAEKLIPEELIKNN